MPNPLKLMMGTAGTGDDDALPEATAGPMFAWGYNGSGQTGDGTVVQKSSPVQIGALTTWTHVYCGQHTIARKSDGTIWSWGRNNYGQLGHGDAINRSSPVQIGALSTWATIAAGNGTSFGIKTDGTLWSWGANNLGQGGDSTIVRKSSPVQIGSLTNWSKIDTNEEVVMAIKTDGTMWSWGYNHGAAPGAGGLGDIITRSSPTQIGSLTTWVYAKAGSASVAIKSDGTMWSWGTGANGGNGRGNVIASSSPIQIGSLTDWSIVSVGGNFTHAVKTDGTLWAWGRNNYSQLGNSATDANTSSPIQIGSLTTWDFVSNIHPDGAALKTDRTAWTWGRNIHGGAGHGTAGEGKEYSSPVQLGSQTDWTRISCGLSFVVGIRGG